MSDSNICFSLEDNRNVKPLNNFKVFYENLQNLLIECVVTFSKINY